MNTTYHIEYRKESNPNNWIRPAGISSMVFNKFLEAEAFVKACLERQKENGNDNYKLYGDRVLEYRIIQHDSYIEETTLKSFSVEYPKETLRDKKEDELHYLKQVFKYLKHLQHLYSTGELKNENYLLYIKVGLNNCESEIKRVENQLTCL
jgi:hypothetical protein